MWNKIHNNPFNGPIVLGFELEALIEHKLFLYRQQHNEQVYLDANEWRYSNYQFNFSRAVKPGQTIEVDIKESQLGKDGLSNRISVKADGNLCLLGFKKESKYSLFLSEAQTEYLLTASFLIPSFLATIAQNPYFHLY